MDDNLFSYQGIVRRRILKRGKIIRDVRDHNIGTFSLFHLFCSALSAPPDKKYSVDCIDICFDSGGGFVSMLGENVLPITKKSILSSPTINTVGVGGVKIGDCSITLSTSFTAASIDHNVFVGENNDSNIFFVLRSGLQSGDNILAYYEDISIKARDFKIADDEVYLVDWTLNVGNYQEASATNKSKSGSNKKWAKTFYQIK